MQTRTIIAVVNEKGGTAKTTTAVNLAAALGALGQKVLLVDLDGQAAASRWLGVQDDPRLADALLAGNGLQPIPDVLPGVWLAPASGKLDSVSHNLRPTQGGQLRKVLAEMTQFDYILIDCPPSLGNRLIGNALLAATHALVPVETSILALDGLKTLLTTLEDVRDGFDHEIVLAGVLACRFDGRTRLSRMVLNELTRALPGKVFQTVIRENVRMRECPATGQSILQYAPLSHAAQDYAALAEEMLARPGRWREPAESAAHDAEPGGQEERFQMDDLGARAAAAVRTAADKAGWHRPAPANDEPKPRRSWKDAPAQAEAVHAAAPQAASEPASDETINSPQAPAAADEIPPSRQVFDTWLSRLSQAERRLAAENGRRGQSKAAAMENKQAAGPQQSPAATGPEQPVEQIRPEPAAVTETPADSLPNREDRQRWQESVAAAKYSHGTDPAHPVEEIREDETGDLDGTAADAVEAPAAIGPAAEPADEDEERQAQPVHDDLDEQQDETAPQESDEEYPALRALLRRMAQATRTSDR